MEDIKTNANYITADQFLREPEEVQKTLIDRWKPQIGDLIWSNESKTVNLINKSYQDGSFTVLGLKCTHDKKHSYYFIPLFSESQLRHIIEEKYGGKIDTTYYQDGYEIGILNKKSCEEIKSFLTMQTDLMQAYWYAACKAIIAEKVKQNA